MKLRYVIEEQGGEKGAAVKRSMLSFDQDSITIGRGGKSDVVIRGELVSLEHAQLSVDGDVLLVRDIGSSSGLRVNRRAVRESKLKNGDRLYLGEVCFRVGKDADTWILLETRQSSPTTEGEDHQQRLTALSVSANLPSTGVLSAVLSLSILLIYFLYPVSSKHYESWSSGPISNPHSSIAQDCKACHATPFTPIADTQCTSCHRMQDHAPAFAPATIASHPQLQRNCIDCHREHRGDGGVTLNESHLCTTCHASPTTVYKPAKAPAVTNVATHPEFTVMLQPELLGGDYVRVRLDETEKLKDNSQIKLNHKKHLEPLRGPKGTVTLECGRCHETTDDLKKFKPISFTRHCQECHPLTFDDRLPDVQVPHGNANEVYNSTYAQYAKLFLGNNPEDDGLRQAFGIRARPGTVAPSVAEQPSVNEDYQRSNVEKESRGAEERLFTKTACQLCHRISPSRLSIEEATLKKVSLYEVIKPEIKSVWMPQAVFNHRAHDKVKCDKCHDGVRESTKTLQVLMPKVNQCRECHADHATNGKVKSECIMCHSYHDALSVKDLTQPPGTDLRKIIKQAKQQDSGQKGVVDSVRNFFKGFGG